MRFLVFLSCVAVLTVGVFSRETGGDRPRSYKPVKGKRGVGDYSIGHSPGRLSYVPAHSSLNSAYTAGGGASGGYSFGHGNIQALQSLGSSGAGHGLGYSAGFGPGYKLNFASGLGHGLNLQGLSLGGHDAVSSATNVGGHFGGNIGLFAAAGKNGPVTFGSHNAGNVAANSASPSYTSGSQGLSAYSTGGSGTISIPVSLGSSHGSSYNLQAIPLGSSSGSVATNYIPVSSAASSGLHSAGLHGSSASYSLPVSSGPSSSLSLNSISSGSHGGSSGYSVPLLSGSSYGLASLSSNAGSSSSYGQQATSGTYSSPVLHGGFSSGSSGATNYMLPITPGSYAVAGAPSTGSYASYSPAASDGDTSYSSGGSASYSVPSSYSSPANTHASSSEVQSAYSNVSPRYLGYSAAKAYESIDSGSGKYDTISYSSPNGKY